MGIRNTYNSFQKLERARKFVSASLHHCAIEFIIIYLLLHIQAYSIYHFKMKCSNCICHFNGPCFLLLGTKSKRKLREIQAERESS